jgi:predicted acyl esterase
MPKPYEGSYQQYDVICQSDTMIKMRDGVCLATDIYFPALNGQRAQGKFPVILECTPYDKAAAGNITNGNFFARSGYICAIQDVRGRVVSIR